MFYTDTVFLKKLLNFRKMHRVESFIKELGWNPVVNLLCLAWLNVCIFCPMYGYSLVKDWLNKKVGNKYVVHLAILIIGVEVLTAALLLCIGDIILR